MGRSNSPSFTFSGISDIIEERSDRPINLNLFEIRIMECPFCGEEMEHGFLYSNQLIGFPWYSDGEKPTKYIPDFWTKKKGGMIFGKTQFESAEFDSLK